jgi:hypothetical protein
MSNVERHSLGQAKEGTCKCGAVFQKKRFDQIFCSPDCLREDKKQKRRVPWELRADREQRNKERSERYYANREAHLAKLREWRKANQEEARARDRATYHRNKASRAIAAKKYRAKYPRKRTEEYKKARQRRPWMMALTNAKHRSTKKSWAFDLTREWCEQNWTGHCAVSGLPFVFGTQTHFPFSPSIDRIDSTKGYTQGNCRFVLFAINSFRGTGTDQDMLHIARAIIQYNQ